ncbi:hypothetical protein N7474_003462 [Penicillium riverlandense]|uniref:uncharacterized protein n=1 Tax=Penicillium riverlandense TaxID=1903569 RepID=UPI0025481A70|nr:uncharacterized protein N7474_003462 [Penicillium riverlandense]KAJ5826324.1 hypothetical protein N7474_003462 [Penicillium riverlandense]
MGFTRLPNEILEIIITHALPEGFESLALTCKHIYDLCAPLAAHHKELRWYFRQFKYYKTKHLVRSGLHTLLIPYSVNSAFNLIEHIAVEPSIARYIQEADFTHDSRYTRTYDSSFPAEGVVRLLADSPYLKEAGIDWKDYWALIKGDLEARRYSQYAAAFILTLLPNLKVLRLPKWWKPVAAADKLIDAVIHRARRPNCSLHRVIKLTVPILGTRFDLYWAIPFLALPCIRSFQCPTCVGEGNGHESSSSRYLRNDFKSSLEVVEMTRASIDELAIAGLLKHAPGLKKLRYSHSTIGHAPQYWNLSQFGTAIAHAVGDHLKELSVSINIDELRGSIPPGKLSMRGFQQLQKLELPLEIVTEEFGDSGSHLEDLVPASVSHLSLIARGTNHCAKALDAIVRQFSIKRDSQAPALKIIYLTCPRSADDSYKEQCTKLAAEAEKARVTLELTPWPEPIPAWQWGAKELLVS